MLLRRIGLIALNVIIVAGVVWFFWSRNGATDVDIATAELDRGNITRAIATSGTVSPLVTVEIGSQVSGLIAELYADFNTPVDAGDIIALIDPATFEQRVTQATADMAVANANIDVQKAAITKADARVTESYRALERSRLLRARGTVSIAALDAAEAGYASTLADLAAARAQLRTAEATLVQRQAALSTAQIDLEYTNIRSPIDGIVIERSVSIGQTMAASFNSPVLFKIAQDLTQIQIEASVDEADIGGIRTGNVTNFTVDAYPDRQFEGAVTQVRLSPEELQSVVTYTVIISADNPDLVLLPGMTANVEIVTGSRENVLRIRNEALRFRPPEDWTEETQAGGFGGGFGPRGGPGGGPGAGPGGGNMVANILDQLPLELTETQRAAVQKDLGAEMQKIFAGGPPGAGGSFNPQAMREQMQQRITSVFERHLDDEQMTAFRQFQATQAREKTATVWVMTEDGTPEPRRARLGITDNRYTEISGGGWQAGDVVVTRVTAVVDD